MPKIFDLYSSSLSWRTSSISSSNCFPNHSKFSSTLAKLILSLPQQCLSFSNSVLQMSPWIPKFALTDLARQRYSNVSYELVVSAPGLVNICEFLVEAECRQVAPSVYERLTTCPIRKTSFLPRTGATKHARNTTITSGRPTQQNPPL